MSAAESGRRGLDLEQWRYAVGVEVPGDELRFLLVPDAVERAMVFELAQTIHAYQGDKRGTASEITKAVMVTMGGLLPGVLLHDHLAWIGESRMEFGTLGVSLYAGPGQRLARPRVVQDVSIKVKEETVLAIDDLGDSGGTMDFVRRVLTKKGAKQVLTLGLYVKPEAVAADGRPDFCFGEVPQGTWIITPREMVETLLKRVPVWQERGASYEDCRLWLEQIGYEVDLINYYLPGAYK